MVLIENFELSELIGFLLMAGTLLFILISHDDVRFIPDYKWIVAAVATKVFSFCFTIVEGIIFSELFNLLEHLLNLLSALFLCTWFYKIAGNRSGED
ncbi:MAG: hypothetical protein ACFFD4_14360 [Candidatus Odinarchaeota archaeon]